MVVPFPCPFVVAAETIGAVFAVCSVDLPSEQSQLSVNITLEAIMLVMGITLGVDVVSAGGCRLR